VRGLACEHSNLQQPTLGGVLRRTHSAPRALVLAARPVEPIRESLSHDSGGSAEACRTLVGPPVGRNFLRETFGAFCGARQDMDVDAFMRLCGDCGLLDNVFKSEDAGAVFQAVTKEDRRSLDVPTFEAALHLISRQKQVELDVVRHAVMLCYGPSRRGSLQALDA